MFSCLQPCLLPQVQFLETRSAGQSIATLINLLFSFVIGQARTAYAICKCSSTLGLHA